MKESKLYEWLWKHTTGEPWTYIMRRRPLYLVLPAVAMVITMAWARRRYKGWVIGLAVGVAAPCPCHCNHHRNSRQHEI